MFHACGLVAGPRDAPRPGGSRLAARVATAEVRFVKMFRHSATLLAVAGLAFAVPARAGNITVKGSDTMVLLAQRWAEKYMEGHKDAAIQVTGGGSGTGIAALLNKTTDIANSSRPIKAAEKKSAREAGIDAEELKVAMDALTVVVHEDNPVTELTMNQVKAIYTGAINNWKDLGGPTKAIVRYSRESNSGTYVFFKEHVLGNQDYATDCQNMPGTAAVATAVVNDPAGIGFGGVAYFLNQPGVKVLKIKKDKDSPAITPIGADLKSLDFAVVYSGAYPIARYLYCYTAGKPKGAVAAYLDWIVGTAGQKIAEELGYIPLEAGATAGSER
jgi:phosphate transport system substrate-binding protein